MIGPEQEALALAAMAGLDEALNPNGTQRRYVVCVVLMDIDEMQPQVLSNASRALYAPILRTCSGEPVDSGTKRMGGTS